MYHSIQLLLIVTRSNTVDHYTGCTHTFTARENKAQYLQIHLTCFYLDVTLLKVNIRGSLAFLFLLLFNFLIHCQDRRDPEEVNLQPSYKIHPKKGNYISTE